MTADPIRVPETGCASPEADPHRNKSIVSYSTYEQKGERMNVYTWGGLPWRPQRMPDSLELKLQAFWAT